jgi:hypothetical protein
MSFGRVMRRESRMVPVLLVWCVCARVCVCARACVCCQLYLDKLEDKCVCRRERVVVCACFNERVNLVLN